MSDTTQLEITTPAKPSKAIVNTERGSAEDIQGLTLVQKLMRIEEDMPEVTKTGHNDKQDYDFVEQATIMNAVRPLLMKYGVLVIPRVVDHKLHNKQGYDKTAGTEVAKGVKVVVSLTFQFINAHDQKDILEIPWTAEGDDYGDKGTNKATTIAQKNMYIRLFNIADADPDAETAEGGSVAAPGKESTPQKQTMIYRMLRQLGQSVEAYETALKKPVSKMSNEEADRAIANMQAAIERKLASETEVS